MNCHRREFLKLAAGALTASLLPLPAFGAILKDQDSRRSLAFYNTHTGESAEICYYDGSGYCAQALDKIGHILRDHRTNQIHTIDPLLLDRLYALKCKIRPTTPFHIISGYRSPATNALLRKTSTGVARKSFHTKGKAIDIRLPGYDTRRLRDICISMKSGGVGYYDDSDFVHLDTGPVRAW